MPLHTDFAAPGEHSVTGEFSAIVADDHARLAASEIEQVIAAAMASQFENPLDLAETTQLIIEPDTFATFQRTALALAGDLRANNLSACASILVRVEVHDRHIVLDLDIRAISTRLGCRRRAPSPDVVSLRHDVRLTRTGHTMRLVDHGGGRAFDETPDATLVRLALRARSWWHILSHGELTPTELARREGVTSSYLIRVVRLAFLSPRVVDALLDGNLRADVNAAALLSPGAIDPDWLRQERRLLAG